MDARNEGLSINFFCTFPCKTCNLTVNTQCFSCYFSNTIYKYLHQDKCIDDCPAGWYEFRKDNNTQPTCAECTSPCATCGTSATDCTTCIEGYIHYDKDNTCYKDIRWPFPFLILAFISFIIVLIVDWYKPATNFLHSVLYSLSVLEICCWCVLFGLAGAGEVQGDRSLALFSFILQILLNLVFIPVHIRLMIPHSSSEYK